MGTTVRLSRRPRPRPIVWRYRTCKFPSIFVVNDQQRCGWRTTIAGEKQIDHDSMRVRVYYAGAR